MIEGPPRFRKKVKVGGDTEAEVFCADEQSEIAVDIERWQKLAIAVLADQGVRGGTELSLFFVSVHDMAELNSEHMGKPGATDVLAFPIDGGEVLEMINGPTGASRGPDRPPPDRGDLPLLLGDIVMLTTNLRCSSFTEFCTSWDGTMTRLKRLNSCKLKNENCSKRIIGMEMFLRFLLRVKKRTNDVVNGCSFHGA